MSAVIQRIVKTLPVRASIADFGCGDASLLASLQDLEKQYRLFGFDKSTPAKIPNGVHFTVCDLSQSLDTPPNSFNLSISSHVIEHLTNPLDYFSEIVRVTKVGGFIVVLAPSDRSTWFSCPISQERNLILSFYDDPTHIGRPWTPQALYRLGKYHGLEVLQSQYITCSKSRLRLPITAAKWAMGKKNTDQLVDDYWKAIGWEVCAVFRKTNQSSAEINYFSFKGL